MAKMSLEMTALKRNLIVLMVLGLFGFMSHAGAAQNPEWARDFYGTVKFQLADDPEFAKAQGELQYLEGELNRIRGLLAQKKTFLQQKNELKDAKLNDLKKTQADISSKTDLLSNSQKEITLQNSKIESASNAILANDQLIRNKTNEIITYNNQLDPLKEKLTLARSDVDLKQKNFDAALAQCQTNNPSGTDCMNDDAQVALARQKLSQAKELEKYLSEQVAHFSQLVGDAQKVMTTAQSNLTTAKTDKANAEGRLVELHKLIAVLGNEIPVLNDRATALTAEVTALTNEISNITGEINNLANIERQQALTYDRHFASFNNLRNALINEIITINHQGRTNAQGHGAREGIEIASDIGTTRGTQDGTPDGLRAGENDGRTRDYQAGAAVGDQEGARRGMDEGTQAGRLSGTRDGNQEAGAREGQASGIAKAERSDASQVGASEGRQAGLQHAADEGQIQGNKRGESEAVSSLEAQTLANTVINGQFAGAFASGNFRPYFPGNRHKYYNENINHSRMVLRLAYTEGYKTGYDAAAEQTFYDNVQKIYKQAYTDAYNVSYSQAFNRSYADSYQAGRQAQAQVAYERQYKPSFDAAYRVARESSLQSPDRNSSVFKNAFQMTETSAYQDRYAQIRNQAFSVAERDTYGQNLNVQIEKFRVKRIAEVQAIYANYPILKFITSSVSDAGVNGVAGKDGIFQPGEKVLHDVTIANFSAVPAQGVKLIATNGQTITLPAIAGKSVVTVKGAILDQVPFSAPLNSQFTTLLAVRFDLTANEKSIQGRYFANASNGVLNSGHPVVVALRFPMDLALRLESPLQVGKTVGLTATIVNKSQRSFMGPLSLELTSSLGSSVIQAQFSDISLIDSSVTKSEARVMIEDVREIFSDVDFSLVIKQSGVVIGEIKNVARDYVKAPYVAIAGAPVIVMKSNTLASRQIYKDLVAELGGATQVSILDLAAGASAQSVLESQSEMKGKTLLVIENKADSLMSSLDKVFKLKNVLVAFISEGGALDKAQATLSSLKGSTRFPLNASGVKLSVLSSSPALNKELTSKVSAVEVGVQAVESLEALASVLKLSDDELLEAIAKQVTAEKFFAQAQDVKLLGQIAIMRTLEEAMTLNAGFVASDKDDKSFVERMKSDNALFFNKFKNVITSGSEEARMANSLLGFALYTGSMKALEDVAPMNSVEKKMRKAFEKSLDDMITGGFLGLGSGTAAKYLKKSGHKDYVAKAKDLQESFMPF